MESSRDLSTYVGGAVPKLFSETDRLLTEAERKFASGGFLHAGEISDLRSSCHEEYLDASALRQMVCLRIREFTGKPEERLLTTYSLTLEIRAKACEIAQRLSESLLKTSIGARFFKGSMAYVEEYESKHGFSRYPGINDETIVTLIGEDMEKAKAVFSDFELWVADLLAPIQGKIAFAQSTGYGAENVPKLLLKRSILAEQTRAASLELENARNADFAAVSKRLSLHGVNISQTW